MRYVLKCTSMSSPGRQDGESHSRKKKLNEQSKNAQDLFSRPVYWLWVDGNGSLATRVELGFIKNTVK